MLWRWLTLAVTPYILFPWMALALMTPSLLLWGFTSAHGLSASCPTMILAWAWRSPAPRLSSARSSVTGGASRWPSAAGRDFSRSSPTQPAAEWPGEISKERLRWRNGTSSVARSA